MNKSLLNFLFLLTVISISLPSSFAEEKDEPLEQKAKEAGEVIVDTGEKAGEVIVDTGEKAGEVIVDTGEKAGEVIVDTGEKAGEVIVDTGEKAGEVIVDTGEKAGEVIVDTGEKATEKGTIIGEVVVEKSSEGLEEINEKGGGCLIATVAYGTELAPQIQFLREIRDNTVMSTASGAAFMTSFNQMYYSFSPTIANMERENPILQEGVRLFITPLISTLYILNFAEEGSEESVLGFGIFVIGLNLVIYIVTPIAVGFKIKKYLQIKN